MSQRWHEVGTNNGYVEDKKPVLTDLQREQLEYIDRTDGWRQKAAEVDDVQVQAQEPVQGDEDLKGFTKEPRRDGRPRDNKSKQTRPPQHDQRYVAFVRSDGKWHEHRHVKGGYFDRNEMESGLCFMTYGNGNLEKKMRRKLLSRMTRRRQGIIKYC